VDKGLDEIIYEISEKIADMCMEKIVKSEDLKEIFYESEIFDVLRSEIVMQIFKELTNCLDELNQSESVLEVYLIFSEVFLDVV